ncbi:hypothetical protein Ddc_09793 [Ditylenchus destructor]|nr:hypothetical protein Ddc_09793 [Ditylenchus destructor]
MKVFSLRLFTSPSPYLISFILQEWKDFSPPSRVELGEPAVIRTATTQQQTAQLGMEYIQLLDEKPAFRT